ncbi:hypothetical protein B1A99_18535 [Cohnella sp. CIP 111063]|jgi:exosome complex RNA-binding protein Rrp4|uniref:hypothetical protein n=1 Tax=unclassified Cohnella TaxID=2636738 RepID=UPI000B8C3B3E|nr:MULTISPECIES: hypothetical protein [unclassified Cohnella]OXS56860.1 hypothetical protein B1A99_18535 [Cohnella sp. CIP 111063]PRX69697.1 hypothetical protein B0G52_11255 [Cohnella sp. SGD-V74]
MAAKQTKLTMTGINRKHDKEFGSLKRVDLSTGDYIEIYQRFRKTSIQKLVLDYLDILNAMKEGGRKLGSGAMVFVYYMLLLKHFTTLGSIIPEDLGQMIGVGEKLLDLGVMEQILNEFPQQELDKLNAAIQEVNRNMQAQLETWPNEKGKENGQ